MKSLSYIITIASFTALLISFGSCDQRDPQAEFESISETQYSSPQHGIDVAQEYIDHFYSKKGNRVTEVSEIRHQYRMMEDFFAHSFNSYSDYVTKGMSINEELSGSVYPGVRNTWKNLYNKELKRLLGPIIDSINNQTFDGFFKNQVWSLCVQQYPTWDPESIDQISLTPPSLINDGTAKQCSGEYRVHLRGKILGIRTSIARVSISGIIGANIKGGYYSERTGYQFLEGPVL